MTNMFKIYLFHSKLYNILKKTINEVHAVVICKYV